MESCRYANSPLAFQSGKTMGSIVLLPNHPLYQRIKDFSHEILQALDSPDGCYHLELFLNNHKELVFLEVAARAPGFFVTRIYQKTFGINLLDIDLQAQAGVHIKAEKNEQSPSFFALFPTQKGTIKDIQSLQLKSPHEIKWKYQIGDKTDPTKSNLDLSGTLFAWNDDYQILCEDFGLIEHTQPLRY